MRCEVRGVRFSVFGVRCAAAPGVHRSAGSCGQMSVCVDGGGFELQDGGKARGNARARTSYSHKLNPKPLSNPSYVEPQTPFPLRKSCEHTAISPQQLLVVEAKQVDEEVEHERVIELEQEAVL